MDPTNRKNITHTADARRSLIGRTLYQARDINIRTFIKDAEDFYLSIQHYNCSTRIHQNARITHVQKCQILFDFSEVAFSTANF